MNAMVDLFWLGSDRAPSWVLGQVVTVPDYSPSGIASAVRRHLVRTNAGAVYFRDCRLGVPSLEPVHRFLESRDDVHHAGLKLGQGGLPGMMDFVQPTWMLNRDPGTDTPASSWRLSLGCCLVRTDVLRQLDGPSVAYSTVAASALEMGLRYLRHGVVLRYEPSLVSVGGTAEKLPLNDELRFIHTLFGRKWVLWAVIRSIFVGRIGAREAVAAWRRIDRPSGTDKLVWKPSFPPATIPSGSVSVLIPTLDRYPYLEVLLGQLRDQTQPPYEIIVIDQTGPAERDETVYNRFTDLPLRVLYREAPGQCSSRNDGLIASTGEFILLLDDDIEIGPGFIRDHLSTLIQYDADTSSGIAIEPGMQPAADFQSIARLSDVLPAGITMVRRRALERSGLFDLAYEKGQRADGDLGMRLYLSGARMILQPALSVLHHRASRGGLRVHKARRVTRSSSRTKLFHRHLPSVTEIYLMKRYFRPSQVHEALLVRKLGTFVSEGGKVRRILKTLIGIFCYLHTVSEVRRREAAAERMLAGFPRIPRLHSERISVGHEGTITIH